MRLFARKAASALLALLLAFMMTSMPVSALHVEAFASQQESGTPDSALASSEAGTQKKGDDSGTAGGSEKSADAASPETSSASAAEVDSASKVDSDPSAGSADPAQGPSASATAADSEPPASAATAEPDVTAASGSAAGSDLGASGAAVGLGADVSAADGASAAAAAMTQIADSLQDADDAWGANGSQGADGSKELGGVQSAVGSLGANDAQDAGSARSAGGAQEADGALEADGLRGTINTQGVDDDQNADSADSEPIELVSARLLVKNAKTNAYEPYTKTTSEEKPLKVAAVRNSAWFDVELAYSDGATVRAGQKGVKVTWRLSNNKRAGREVVTIDDKGKMSLSGAESKLVQLKAWVGDVEVKGCPAYVNLVGDAPKPGAGKAVASVDVTYQGSGEAPSAGAVAPAAVPAEEVRELDVPAVTAAGGTLVFNAMVTFVDAQGNVSVSSGSLLDVQLAWQITALYDVLGERTSAVLATVASSGGAAVFTATRAGNGWAVLRCASNAYPDFSGQEVLVRIAGNDPVSPDAVATNTVSNVTLVYKDADTGEYLPYAGSIATTPTVISTPGGSVSFDSLLTFVDGSSARAGERGLATDYSIAGNVVSGSVAARMAPDGTLTALHTKDGTVRIVGATVNDRAAAGTPAYVRIKNNDASVQPQSDELLISAISNYWVGATQRPNDASQDWYWRAVANGGSAKYSVPLVVSTIEAFSTCTLQAAVAWTNSATTKSKDEDGGKRTWRLVKSVDFDGRSQAPIVTVGENGAVAPTGAGSGYATVACTVDLPVYDAEGNRTLRQLVGECKVAVYASQGYVKSIELLNEKGDPIQTSAIKLASGKNTYKFAARITYVGYDPETHGFGERVVDTTSDSDVETGLEWSTWRSEERSQVELYSQIRPDGMFKADSGFARAYVYAQVKQASFTGKDIGAGVSVIAEDSVESVGRSDSVDVQMYHYSDYLNRGDAAAPAKEVTLSRGQLTASADYTTWYTFQRRGDAFSTVYARGVTMRTLLAMCGVDPDRLVSMAFMGADGYFAQRHSASFILGSQYRYTNYYFHKDLPGLMGAQSVSPMFAVSYYMKNNAGYEDSTDKANGGSAGFGYLAQDSTLRVIFGMTGANVRNANLSVSKVNRIQIVVEDNTFPVDEDNEEEEAPPKEPEKREPEELFEQNGAPGTEGEAPEDGSTDPKGDSMQPKPEEGLSTVGEGQDERGLAANPFYGRSDEGVGTDVRHGGTVVVGQGSPDDAAALGEADGTNDRNDDKGSEHGESLEDSPEEEGAKAQDAALADEQVPAAEQADVQKTKDETDRSGNPLIRELREKARPVLKDSEIAPIWWASATAMSLLAFFVGGLFAGRRYVVDRADGVAIARRG